MGLKGIPRKESQLLDGKANDPKKNYDQNQGYVVSVNVSCRLQGAMPFAAPKKETPLDEKEKGPWNYRGLQKSYLQKEEERKAVKKKVFRTPRELFSVVDGGIALRPIDDYR